MNFDSAIKTAWSPELLDKFKASAEKIDARVYTISNIAELASAISNYHKDYRSAVCIEPDNALAKQLIEKGIKTTDNSLEADISITSALFGIADTGSVVLDTTNVNLRKQTALVKAHLVILNPKMIVPSIYEAFDIIGEISSGQKNFNYSIITGPSRTADIERVLTLGVHGPEILDIYLWEYEPPGSQRTQTTEVTE